MNEWNDVADLCYFACTFQKGSSPFVVGSKINDGRNALYRSKNEGFNMSENF